MFPVPHVLLFLPICVFTALFFAAVGVNFVIAAISRPQPTRRTAIGRAAIGRAAANHAAAGAQIIYFKPRKSALPSSLSLGAS
jgi:hypothetical protein